MRVDQRYEDEQQVCGRAPWKGAPAERRIDSVLGGLSMGLAQLSWQDDLFGGRSIR
jgi:hypothetical protein